MPDFTFNDLLLGTSGTQGGGCPGAITGFSIDTRTLKPGEVYIAIKGETHDGHAFIPKAIEAKASAIIASSYPEGKPRENQPAWIKVSEPLTALQNLARWQRSRLKALFLGVTGSNGKTTTKEMMAHLFSGRAPTWATPGNFNNHIGLPLNLVRIPHDVKTAIIEMGMNHEGEIRFLAGIAHPDSALITNVGPAHIGNLGSLENIALAKAEILEELPTTGFAILNGDDPFFPTLRSRTKAHILRFGFGDGNDIRGTDLKVFPDRMDLRVTWQSQTLTLRLHLLGKHNALNALGALGIYLSQGGDFEAGVERLSSFQPVSARMESQEIEGRRVILDCYNANPASMTQAVDFLGLCSGRRVAVLGDMRELGDTSETFHRQLGIQVAEKKLDQLVVVGEFAQYIAESALSKGMPAQCVHCCRDTEEAAKVLSNLLLKGDTVLLKASRGMHFEGIVKKLWPTLPCELH